MNMTRRLRGLLLVKQSLSYFMGKLGELLHVETEVELDTER